MDDFYSRDPEEVGPEHPDDVNHRMNLIESRHWFDGGEDGDSAKCKEPTRKFCYEHLVIDYHNECGSRQSSVLHFDEDQRMEHDHGGGDCMCFEGEPW